MKYEQAKAAADFVRLLHRTGIWTDTATLDRLIDNLTIKTLEYQIRQSRRLPQHKQSRLSDQSHPILQESE